MVPQVVVGQSVTVGDCIQAKTTRSDVSTVANVERTTDRASEVHHCSLSNDVTYVFARGP